jgi:hypothetical protein
MGVLERNAMAEMAETAILVATEDGRALYNALGWALHSPYTSAAIKPITL